jgi:hypothetical protein
VNSIEFPLSSSIHVFNAVSVRAVKTVSASCTGDFPASEAWITFPDDSNQGFVALVFDGGFRIAEVDLVPYRPDSRTEIRSGRAPSYVVDERMSLSSTEQVSRLKN